MRSSCFFHAQSYSYIGGLRRVSQSLKMMAVAGIGLMLGVCSLPAFGQAATTTTLTLSSAGTAVLPGGSIVSPAQLTLTARVLAGTTPVTKGTVNFCVTGAKLCTDVNLIGSGQLTSAGTAFFTFVPPISKLNAGSPVPFSYTAVYVGTTTNATSSSAAATVAVTGTFPTTSVLTSTQTATNPPPYVYTLVDTVTGNTQNYPSGTITFQDTTDNNYVLGTSVLVAGTSSFVLTPKPLVPSATFPRYVDVGDLNGDGIDDIAVADFYLNTSITPNSSTVDIFFGKGDGTFTAGPLLSVGATFGPQFAVLGDFNNDGCLDVLAESYANNDILLFLNTKTAGVCSGAFQAVKTYSPAGLSGPGGLAVGDFNRDGNLDFVVNNNNAPGGNTSNQGINSLVFFGDGAGNFSAGGTLAPGGTINPVFTAVGDFNGDGYPDLAIANDVSATIDIYLNNGTGGFTLKTAFATPVTNNIVLAADFNQDGKLDLAAESGQTSNPITIWLGNGDGTFTRAANPPVGAVAVASAAEADLNGDGIPDLIYNTSSPTAGGQIGVLLGKGDGTFTAPTTTYSTLGKDSLSLAVGDFNGDGYSDVVIGNYSGDLATPQANPNGVLSIYLAGYQTTGTATANLSGVSVNGATVSPHQVDAVFPTSSVYSTSTSNTVPLIPNVVTNDALSLAALPTGGTYGTQIALTATLTNYSAQGYTTNGENVTFTLLGAPNTVLGTAPLTSGVATLNTTTLPVGADQIQATYTSDGNFASATSNTATVTITPAAATATLTATPNTTTYGTPVTLTETIQPISGTCPAGPATFKDNGATLGTGNITLSGGSCVATLTTANLPVGSDIITATVPTSGDFATINSGPTTVTIGKAPVTNPTTPVLSQGFTATPSSTTFGSPVTFVYTVPVAVGNAAPTGPVVISSPGFTSVTCTNFVPGTTVAVPVPNPLNQPAYTPYTCTTSSSALPVGSPDTVTATYTTTDPNYAGGAPALTRPVTITAATPADVLTTSNPTPVVGSAVTFTNTITLINGAVPPSPPVFSYTIGTTTVTLGSGTATATPGVYTLTTTALPVGSATVVATLPAGGSYASTPSNTVAETIGKVPFNPNTDVLTSSQNPSIFGNPVTFTETIPTVNGLAPSGTVTFYVNGTTQIGTVAVPLSGNVAISVPTSTLATPSDPITAVYSGDANYQGGTSALTQVVNVATAGATLTAGPNPATFGTPVTIVETLVPINGVCPPGPVTFFDNTGSGPVQIVATGNPATVGTNCVASITTSSLPVGANSITATAPASGNFGAVNSGPLPVTINKAAPADLLTSSLNPSTVGQSVTFTDTIPIALAGTPPTGTVQFYDYGVAIGTPQPVNSAGVATIATTTLPPGTDAITAVYSGDGNYAQVTSNQVNQVVNPIATTATLSVGPNPATFGTTVTLQETIPVVNGIPATGTVTFTTPNGTLTTPINASGVASVTTSTLPVGADPITASYPGNTNYTAVNSGPVIETITKANGADVLAVGPNPQVFGSLVTATDTIPTVGGVAPTGTVTFYNNGPTGTNLGTFPVTNGVATLTTTTLPVGSNPITAVYNGDGNYAVVTSNQVNEVITVGNTTPVLGASPNPSTFGTLVTITESIPGINGVTPTGTVTFTYIPAGSTTPVTLSNGTTTAIPLVNGVATVTSTTLPIGVDAVTAVYSGDTNYGKATTGPLNVTVNLANPTDTVSANPNPVTFGSPTTLTFTVPLVNGVVPTGTVAFYDGTTPIGTGNVNAQGIATLTTSALPLGTSTVTAKYPGDNTYASSSPTTPVTVTTVTPVSTITTNPTGPAVACGTSVTLTDTITAVNGVTAAGTVQFYDNGVAIGSPVTVTAGGTASLTTTALNCGANSITAIFTPTAGSPYNPSTAGPTPVPLSAEGITFPALPNTPFGSKPPVPGATATNPATPVTYSTTSTACSVTSTGVITFNNAGSCAITASQAAGINYAAPTPVTQTFQITPVTPTSVLTSPTTPPACGTSVALTDTITSVGGYTVAGTVQFYDNGVAIGSPVTVAAGGVATLTTTTLACGATNSITAVFTPTAGGPYNPSTAGPTPVAVAAADFTISATPANQVVNPGDSAVYTVSLSGVTVPFTSPVALTATCNCQGVTISFANATVTPGQGPTTTTMTVATSPTFAMSKPSHGANQIFYGLLLLPLLGLGKVRRKLRKLPKGISYCLAALVLLGGLGAVTGCGGGYYGPQPKTCTITITGTSGTLTHSTTVTLTVR